MLRFFRQIRQGLLTDNKFSKYLLYAVGEILLVVIGILIALQVNDWAEASKKRRFLNYSLAQIHQDLESDLQLIYGGIEPRLQRKEKGIKELYALMLQDSSSDVDVFRSAYRAMSQWFYLTSKDGSYQSLKQKGLDIISNRSCLIFTKNQSPGYVNSFMGGTNLSGNRYLSMKRIYSDSNCVSQRKGIRIMLSFRFQRIILIFSPCIGSWK